MITRIDRTIPDWHDDNGLAQFQADRITVPTALWRMPLDECNCCDPNDPESSVLAIHCETLEFDFGPNWTFVATEHKHVSGLTFRVDLDTYKNGVYSDSQTITGMLKGKFGQLSPFAQMENQMLKIMGAPVTGRFQEERT